MILRFLHKHALLFCIFTTLFGLTISVAFAQSSQSFSLSPTLFTVEAEPGQEWRTTLRLINTNTFPLEISATVRDFVPGPDGNTPQFLTPDESSTSTFANWIDTEARVTVGAEQTYELPINVRVPTDAQPGGHFAAILISTSPQGASGTGVGTSQAISSLLFLRVAGEISEVATVRSFRTTEYLVPRPEATFEIRIENRGNVHVQPQGEVVIYNMWGQERGIIPMNKQSLFGNVLPDSIRTYRFVWSGEWSLADIGRYTAEVVLSYGSDGRKTIFDRTTFWFVPWQWILGILLVLIAFLGLLRWAIRLYIKRMFSLAGISTDLRVKDQSIATEPQGDVETLAAQKVSVMAPLEAGLLDLRKNLKEAPENEQSKLTVYVHFITANKIFFIVAAAVVAVVITVGWFISSATSPDRDFMIMTEDGVSTTAEEARALREPAPATNATDAVDGAFLTLINRSGDVSTEESVRRLLEGGGYTITAAEFDPNAIEDRTVIVYPVEETDRALELSKILNEAPLSALSDSEARTREIIIYIGSDASRW